MVADLDPGHGPAGLAVNHAAAQGPALDDGQVGRRVGAGPHPHPLHGGGRRVGPPGHFPQ